MLNSTKSAWAFMSSCTHSVSFTYFTHPCVAPSVLHKGEHGFMFLGANFSTQLNERQHGKEHFSFLKRALRV